MIFVFNGDADGIFSLKQLSLFENFDPRENECITNVKRKTDLLKLISMENGPKKVTALDIEIEKNERALTALLTAGWHVRWFDHHLSAGDRKPQSHNLLELHLNVDTNVNTSLIVDHYCHHVAVDWAVAGLFGDNMNSVAEKKATDAGLNHDETTKLKKMGHFINYNSYGEDLKDLVYHPLEIVAQMADYRYALDFFNKEKVIRILADVREEDFTRSLRFYQKGSRILFLPNEKWAFRIAGEIANYLQHFEPDLGHAVLTGNVEKGYRVSVRTSLQNGINERNAAYLCQKFKTGGGRIAAAGINHLPGNDVEEFLSLFELVM